MHVQGKGGSKITNLENIPYGWFLGDIKYIKDVLLWEKEIIQGERAKNLQITPDWPTLHFTNSR